MAGPGRQGETGLNLALEEFWLRRCPEPQPQPQGRGDLWRKGGQQQDSHGDHVLKAPCALGTSHAFSPNPHPSAPGRAVIMVLFTDEETETQEVRSRSHGRWRQNQDLNLSPCSSESALGFLSRDGCPTLTSPHAEAFGPSPASDLHFSTLGGGVL